MQSICVNLVLAKNASLPLLPSQISTLEVAVAIILPLVMHVCHFLKGVIYSFDVKILWWIFALSVCISQVDGCFHKLCEDNLESFPNLLTVPISGIQHHLRQNNALSES